jgi:hypothetical protein
MGAEIPVDTPVVGKRTTRRSRVLLAARLRTQYGDIDARLRDLSQKGALIECRDVPPVGTQLIFIRGGISVPARVAWVGRNRLGLEFVEMIDEGEVLVQLGGRAPASVSAPQAVAPTSYQPRCRRPRLHGEGLSEHERRLAEAWGVAVGIAVPDSWK